MKTLQSFLLLLIFVSGITHAQEYKEILRDIFYEGEFFLMEESYIDALGEFQKLIPRGYAENANVNYRIGICYLNIPGEKDKSIPYLEKAVTNVTKKYREGVWRETQAAIDAWLYLGNAYRITNDLDKAVECYDTYRDQLDDPDSEMDVYAEKQIQACNNAREAMENPVYLIRENMGDVINTETSDFNPAVSGNEEVMVYMTSLPFYDAVKMSKKVEGQWTEPINITPEIQSDGDQYINSLSTDGTEMYLNKEDEFNSDIYYSRYENDRWSKSKPLNKLVNSKFWESHACISPDGKSLYLASNRRGSYGGTDIYVSRKNELGIWDEPVNLGQRINTELNEDNPFITGDGNVLYFSSQGHYNIGGYDIFYAERLPDGNWSEPKNLGYPVNTTDDDLFFMPVENGKYGYQAIFADENLGSRDIYRYEFFGTEQEYLAAVAPPAEPEEAPPVEEPAEEAVPEAPAKIYIIRPVFFDFDRFALKPEAKDKLDELALVLEALPLLRIEAVGHTDSKGSDNYNMMLARKRSGSVVEYLASKGIDGKRLKSSSMGESSPVAINSNPDGSDNPEGRSLNRRVEFRITSTGLPNVEIEQVDVPDRLRR